MKRQWQLLRALYVEESGQDLMEYALIVALVALLAIASIGTLGVHIRDYVFNNIVTPLQGI
ncbi:MAG TPA: hypothetical protein VKT75_08930 [Acidobacteriaceae bacterium]|jgi:Flp pilus assembly pilin Flp|nr:hypothetical protein [Acidobacteriaceae bacterium]